MAKIVETPLMKQYVEMKRRHPDAILLFRVGDFYETFSDDAIAASEILGITLTRRANGSAQHVELAGFPHHALDSYLPKLVRAGKRVAICEQLEDPKATKKLVKRGITEVITPGVTTSDTLLDNRTNNFLAAIHFAPAALGIALLDISTGEFMAGEGDPADIAQLLERFQPKEVLIERGNRQRLDDLWPGARQAAPFEMEDWAFNPSSSADRLLRQFDTQGLKGFGLNGMPLAVTAAGAILHYLDITEHKMTGHIRSIARLDRGSYVHMDRFTLRALELTGAMHGGEGKSLLDVVDRTSSPMGARLLRRWLTFPLKDAKAINRRLDVVEYFFKHPDERDAVGESLMQVGDLERLVGKVSTRRISPREMRALSQALQALAPVRDVCISATDQPVLKDLGKKISLCQPLRQAINRTIVADAPAALSKGNVIAAGVDAELDDLRALSRDSRDYLRGIQQRESTATGIPSLKIGFNNVFGYYIEVTNTHRDKVPADWIRKQTLVNAERYVTPELKEYEQKILSADEKIAVIESRIYNALVEEAARYIDALQADAAVMARLDCLLSFTIASIDNRYVRPTVDDSLDIELNEARHPVIERQLPPGTPYISNTVKLSNRGQQIMMITGPNMSGKSAVLRQTALNVILAQAGCFVAAQSARIGVVDKIFTRVGASDNLSAGESTFMVEMAEAAAILNNMSERSLILFDELGRGTSTYDGISIAWAVVEHIHEHGNVHPKTLFATHYHELNDMADRLQRVVNYNVSVKEIDGKVVFLRKLVPGGSAHSFGIHVAKLAGMPSNVVTRADNVLKQLESISKNSDVAAPTPAVKSISDHDAGMQLSFFQLDDPVLSQLRDAILGLDINNLTPLQALSKLDEIKSILTGR